ncbi:MAG: hypothetical protein WAU88_16080 [Candidatus Zixiibacteriota bacterium]
MSKSSGEDSPQLPKSSYIDLIYIPDVDLQQLKHQLEQLNAPFLREPADAFWSNISVAYSMTQMPAQIVGECIRVLYQTIMFIRARTTLPTRSTTDTSAFSGVPPKDNTSEQWALASKLYREFFSDRERSSADIGQWIELIFSRLETSPEYVASIKVLSHTTISLLWTGLECLLRDTWVSALNNANTSVAHRILRAIDDDDSRDGIGSKHIQVNVLAKYNFDLRGNLGTLLEPKFRFSDLESAKRAYASLIGNSDKRLGLLANETISYLERCRHLVVHRAGRVDSKFKLETACATEIGGPLSIDNDQLSSFLKTTANTGASLLELVDDWYRSIQPSAAQ